MIRGIIFDFDGTLVDSNEIHIEGFKYALKRHDMSIGSKEVVEMFGIPGEQILKKHTPLDDETIKEVMKRKRSYCSRMIERNGFPEESKEVIEKLKSMGYKVAIVTASHKDFIRKVVPDDLVHVLYTSDDDMPSKPAPDALLAAAKDLELNPEECVYVGDSHNDYKSAVNAKMSFIAVKDHLTWDKMSQFNPPMVIDELHDLTHIFNAYPKELE